MHFEDIPKETVELTVHTLKWRIGQKTKALPRFPGQDFLT